MSRTINNSTYAVKVDQPDNESGLTVETGAMYTYNDELKVFLNGSARQVQTELNQVSGWGTYVDTQYTVGSPFAVTADTDTVLPNNAGTTIETQKPTDITTFYDGSVITGRNGDSLDLQLYFKAVPSAANQWLDVWVDIGGSVGELYRQTFAFPRGAGTARGIMYSLASAYTLDTWETNGGTVYVRSNASVDIYGITYNFDRTHKAI